MRTALEAVGLRMLPQFRRIGGMLADEVPIDAAALHAAIIAINEALEENSPGKFNSFFTYLRKIKRLQGLLNLAFCSKQSYIITIRALIKIPANYIFI